MHNSSLKYLNLCRVSPNSINVLNLKDRTEIMLETIRTVSASNEITNSGLKGFID